MIHLYCYQFKHFTAELLMEYYCDVIMGTITSQITSSWLFTQSFFQAEIKKHQSPASLAFVQGIHRWPVNSPHKGPITRKMLPFDDVIMKPLYTACHGMESRCQCHCFVSRLMDNYVNVNKIPLKIHKRPLATFWENFRRTTTFP